MHFSTALIALVAAELGTAAAVPATGTIQKRSFSVDRVAAGPAANRNVLKSMKKAFNKYGLEIPGGISDADESAWEQPARDAAGGATPTPTPSGSPPNPSGTGVPGGQTGNVTNQPTQGDVEFVSPIKVGGQTIMMDFDTGSSDLWLFSTSLPQQDQQNHTVFDPSKSPTFKQQQGSRFDVSFGDGSAAQGNVVGTDTVEIGGATATGQTVELASQVAQSFVKDSQSNGLVGLAFSSINQVKPQKAKTFLDTIQDQLAQPIMAANLRHGAAGSYQFGEIDNSAFKGDLQFTPVNNTKGFWQFPSTQFAIGNGTPQTNQVASPAIADTGTTLMLVDDAVAQMYWAAVPGAQQNGQTGMFQFPCNANLPDFKVELGPNNMATIPGNLLNFQKAGAAGGGAGGAGGARRRFARYVGKPQNPRDIVIEVGFPQPGQPGQGQGQPGQPQGPQCIGALQGNQGQGIQIYGDVLFKAQYAVFNIGNTSIGFAPHA